MAENASGDQQEQKRLKVTSAGRILYMLQELKRANATMLYQAMPVALLGHSPNAVTAAAALNGFGLCQRVIDDFKEEVAFSRLQDYEREYCLAPLTSLTEKLFPSQLNQAWGTYREQLDGTLLEQFKGVDMVLRRYVDELQLEKSDLETFLESINDALKAAHDLDVPIELRDFLLQQLLNVYQAVQQYKFRGYAGIRDAMAGYMTAFAAASPEIEKANTESGSEDGSKASKTPNQFLKRLGNVVLAFQLVHSIAHEVKAAKPYVLEAWHDTQNLLDK